MPSASKVFINIAYDKKREPILLGLTAALIALGRIPRLTFEITEGGVSRLDKILDLIGECPVSFHDLSATGLPPRFNMPFELGIACAHRHYVSKSKHEFHVMDSEKFRPDVTLSDMKGFDHKVHNGTPEGAMKLVLSVLDKKTGVPVTLADAGKIYREMKKLAAVLKRQHGEKTIFSKRIHGSLVLFGIMLARHVGLHKS